MNYTEFKHNIKQNNKMQNYYQLLVHFTKDILLDISLRNQYKVAQDLGLTSVKFSHLLPMLKELHNAELLVSVSEMDELVILPTPENEAGSTISTKPSLGANNG